MSLLSTSRDAIILDGNFTSAHIINQYQITTPTDYNPYQLLVDNVALEALFDSGARFDPPKCHPETRTAILEHLHRWATDAESSPLMWIKGAAGAGKSAIAQTLSERWDLDGLLAASFFFSRTSSRRNEKKYFIPTLAYQISIAIPSTRLHIEATLRGEPKIFDRNLRTQMRKLIIDPFVLVSRSVQIPNRIVIIDGLDECCVNYPHQNYEQQQKEILESIQLALDYADFPLRFVITSRPERQIREIFDQGPLGLISSHIALDHTQNPAADIKLYLRCKFEEIRRLHPDLGSSWPSDEIISRLVEKSSGHFIYAAIAARFLSSPRMDPEARLQEIMKIKFDQSTENPFADLDALYIYILSSIAPQSISTVLDVFGLMIYGDITGDSFQYTLFVGENENTIHRASPTFLHKYLFMSLRQLYLHLIDLHSILDIPPIECPDDTPTSFLHASFSEFLTDRSRSGRFYIDREQRLLHHLSLCVRHLCVQLLSPNGGVEEGYHSSGFAYETTTALTMITPNDNIMEGFRAIVNKDDNAFADYVRHVGLESFGTTRRSMDIIWYLYEERPPHWWEHNLVPIVLASIKKHAALPGFMPLNPAIFHPTKYSKRFSW